MANFLGNLGAAFRGQQEYQTWQDQTDAAKVRLEADRQRLSELKDLTAQAKKQREQQPTIDQTTLDYLAGAQAIAPPPQTGMPNGAQAPAPGQQSVPMQQPTMPYPQQRQMGPGVPPGGGMPPPPGPPQGAGGPPTGQPGPPPQRMPPPGQPQGQPPIPPYQTVGGAPRPQQGPQGIPPPPQPAAPPPNSMSLQDAAQFIKARGITDPAAGLQILEKLSPYLNNQARMEAAQLKQQLDQQNKVSTLQEKYDALKVASEDRRYSVDERREAQAAANDTRRLIGTVMAGIAQQNANTRAADAGTSSGKNADEGATEAAAWNYLLKGQNPPARGGMYAATMKKVSEIAKENNMSVQELTSASADVKTKLAAKSKFEVRAQNMERAENQILSEIPVMKDAMKALDLSSLPDFQKAGIAGLRRLGDPRVTTLDQAAETVFNEFQGIITGNPGTLNVSDVAQAKHNYENARTAQQMEAALAGMQRIMGNAKKALATTRKDILTDINDSFKKEKSGVPANAPALPTGWTVKVN